MQLLLVDDDTISADAMLKSEGYAMRAPQEISDTDGQEDTDQAAA